MSAIASSEAAVAPAAQTTPDQAVHAPARIPVPAQRPTPRLPLHIDAALAVDGLSLQSRRELGKPLYDIFCESYGELDQSTVCDEIVFRPGGKLHIIRDADGTIVGFGTSVVEEFAVRGRTNGVIKGGVYYRRDVRGGGALWSKRSALTILEEKLRHPRRPLFYAGEALTPVSYRLHRRTFNRFYPAHDATMPPAMAELFDTVLRVRGTPLSGNRPYIIRYSDPASHREPERIVLSDTLLADPDIRFYLQYNPDFVAGDVLCVIAPLEWRDLFRMFSRQFISSYKKALS